MKFRKIRTALTRARCLRTAAASVLFIASAAALAADSADANVQLQADVRNMAINVQQGAPLPPGGCQAGHSWHSGYGGCRRAVSEPETQYVSCPAGYNGNASRARYRTNYVLQANSADVAYGSWGEWSADDTSSCSLAAMPGLSQPLLERTSASGWIFNQLYMDHATGRLVCGWFQVFQGSTSDPGSQTMPAIGNYDLGNYPDMGTAGSCTSSGSTATLFGGDDGSMPGGRPYDVVSSVIGCQVTVELHRRAWNQAFVERTDYNRCTGEISFTECGNGRCVAMWQRPNTRYSIPRDLATATMCFTPSQCKPFLPY